MDGHVIYLHSTRVLLLTVVDVGDVQVAFGSQHHVLREEGVAARRVYHYVVLMRQERVDGTLARHTPQVEVLLIVADGGLRVCYDVAQLLASWLVANHVYSPVGSFQLLHNGVEVFPRQLVSDMEDDADSTHLLHVLDLTAVSPLPQGLEHVFLLYLFERVSHIFFVLSC